MTQEKDKFICEKLGICWHDDISDKAGWLCSCGRKTKTWVELLCHLDVERNPDFTSEAGRVQLLKLALACNKYGLITFIFKHSILQLTDLLTDDTGKFRDAVFEWLGGEGG